MTTVDSKLLRSADKHIVMLWWKRIAKLRHCYGEYKGRPVVRIWSSKGSPCKQVLRSYGMVTFLADLCMVFMTMKGIPKSVLEKTYYHFRNRPHFRPMEVENYVKEIYKKQDGTGNTNTRR